MFRLVLWLSLLPVVGFAAPEVNWTRFRGPNGSGHSSATTIPVTWTPKDYNWKVTLPGTGHSSPVVWGKKVFLTCATEASALRMVVCLSTVNGGMLWRRNYESPPFRQHRDNSFASASPAVDDKGVYVTWTTPDEVTLLGLDHDGKEKWRRRLGGFESRFGSGASPIVVGDLVILPNDQRGESFIIAVDRESGKTRWKTARRSSNTPNITPCLYTPPGDPPELVLINTTHGVTSLDPETGTVNWELDGLARNLKRERPVSSPIIASGAVIGGYGMAGQGTQLFAVRPGSKTGDAKPQLLRRFARPAPYVPTPIARGDRLFVWHDSGAVLCYRTTTGEQLWRGKVEGSFYGSPVLVNGHLYCISKKGVVVVLPAADTFRNPRRGRGHHVPENVFAPHLNRRHEIDVNAGAT